MNGHSEYCPHRILVVDSYDSFTHNVVALVSQVIPNSLVYVIHNDQIPFKSLLPFLQCFSAVVVGPGPGSPLIPTDIGVVKDIWHVPEELLTPVFGVCLGLQSLAVEFGSRLLRLRVVKHGQVSSVYHSGEDIFKGLPNTCHVVRYHSLCVDTSPSSDLVETAWTDDGDENGVVVMGIKHKTRPFWAVQYHPESVCTDKSGHDVFRNFWALASEWRHAHNKQLRPWDDAADTLFGQPWPHLPHLGNIYSGTPTCEVSTSIITLPHLSIPQICEVIGVYKSNSDFVLLDSAAQPGRFAIIGCLHPNTVKIQYYIQDSFLTIVQGKQKTKVPLGQSDIWTWLASFMRSKKAIGGHAEVPFWGGLIGFLSYELGVDSLDVRVCRKTTKQGSGSPDINLVFVDRSIVVDTKGENVYLQSLLYGDEDWFAHTSSALQRAAQNWDSDRATAGPSKNIRFGKPKINIPDQHAYMSRVKDCQEFLFSGDSYELCYTARTRINLPKTPAATSQNSWDLYKTIRSVNPAPYAAYMRLYPTTLLSSSPERFLSYSRPPHQRLQLRPIKGTVRKGNGMTRERAEAILNTPKEIGENLMIVDLIRHDLYGVVGKNVDVTKFCGIEEYETVWQLVSVIDGCPDEELEAAECDQIGWEMLKRSLPPGSMTGAPKKRSVQILQELESDERTIYSGVAGFWCVSGAGDWSVIIRSLYRCEDPIDESNGVDEQWTPRADGDDESDRSSTGTNEKSESSDEECPTGYDEWTLGAGGAITALSTPEGEWEEMLVKLQSVLRAFGAKPVA